MVIEIKKNSIDELKQKAEAGDAEAQSALGLLYELGLEVKADPKEAAKYWGMAAKKGDPIAQYSLAQIISKDFEDTEEHRAMSQVLFKKAEEHGLLREDKVLRGLAREQGRSTKILIVDDSPIIRAPLKKYLEADQCEVFEANDGQEALNILKKEPTIKLVFSDLKMPHMDGLQMTKIIRSNAITKDIPVVIITGESTDEFVRKGKDAGVQGWIVKPARPHLLRRYVLKYL